MKNSLNMYWLYGKSKYTIRVVLIVHFSWYCNIIYNFIIRVVGYTHFNKFMYMCMCCCSPTKYLLSNLLYQSYIAAFNQNYQYELSISNIIFCNKLEFLLIYYLV